MIFSSDPSVWLKDLFIDAGMSYSIASFFSILAIIFSIAVISWLSNVITKAIILRVVTRIVKRSKTQWDDIFLEQKVFTRLSHLAPAFVIWYMSGWALKSFVSCIQLSSNKMLKVGDWITIPKRDVDGVVTDITLNTVKVQNEILEHLLAIMPQFELKVFQSPSGHDLIELSATNQGV